MRTSTGTKKFQDWLVQQLLRTRWAREKTDVDACAKRLGVQPAVLKRARAEYGTKIAVETHGIFLSLPEVIFEEYKVRCATNQLEHSVLLRGLIQQLLLSGRKPAWLGRGWFLGGKRFLMRGKHGERWPWNIRAEVSRGAERALEEIAKKYRTTKTGLVRGQVIDYLDGKVTKLVLIDATQMSNTARAYTKLWDL